MKNNLWIGVIVLVAGLVAMVGAVTVAGPLMGIGANPTAPILLMAGLAVTLIGIALIVQKIR
jgi:hypothetical protein